MDNLDNLDNLDEMNINKLKVYDIVLIAILSSVLFAQEQVLTFLPNVQLTVFLLVLYSKKLGMLRTIIIVIIYVVLDNVVMGSMSLYYTPTMLVGWLIIPITLNTIFKKVESNFGLALLGVLYSFIYSWLYIIPSSLLTQVSPLTYLISDVLFEIILAMSSFISILLLYSPCAKVIDIISENHIKVS